MSLRIKRQSTCLRVTQTCRRQLSLSLVPALHLAFADNYGHAHFTASDNAENQEGSFGETRCSIRVLVNYGQARKFAGRIASAAGLIAHEGPRRVNLVPGILSVIAFVVAIALPARASDRPPFSISYDDLKTWGQSITITLKGVTILGHSPVHPVGNDCEMHFGAKLDGFNGTPSEWVLEPMNVCIEPFPGKKRFLRKDWISFGNYLINKTVEATGVPRIWPEHLVGGKGPSNPNHAVELRPLTNLRLAQKSYDFSKLVYVPDGFEGGLKLETALKLLKEAEVTVRRSDDNVEINLDAGRIGNFAKLDIALSRAELEERADGYRLKGTVIPEKGTPTSPLTIIAPAGSQGYETVAQFKASGRSTLRADGVLVLFSLDPRALADAAAASNGNEVSVKDPIQLIMYGVEQE